MGGTCTSASTTIDVTSSSFSQTLSLSSTTSGTVSCQYVAHRSLTGGRLRLSLSAVSVSKWTVNDYQRQSLSRHSKTIEDYRRLSETIEDYRRLSNTIKDFQRL